MKYRKLDLLLGDLLSAIPVTGKMYAGVCWLPVRKPGQLYFCWFCYALEVALMHIMNPLTPKVDAVASMTYESSSLGFRII